MDARGGPPLLPGLSVLVGGAMEKMGREELAELCEKAAGAIRANPEGCARAALRLASAMRAVKAAGAAK